MQPRVDGYFVKLVDSLDNVLVEIVNLEWRNKLKRGSISDSDSAASCHRQLEIYDATRSYVNLP